MNKIDLIQIINGNALRTVTDYFEIQPIDVENIIEDDYVILANQILMFPEEYSDEEKFDIAELFIDIVTEEIKAEDMEIERSYYRNRR